MMSIKSAFLPQPIILQGSALKDLHPREPSVLQLNFDVQPRHVRLQSDDLAAPRVVRNGSSPSFLTCLQNHLPGLPLWRPFSQSRRCCMSPDSDLDSSHLAQLSALLPQHNFLLPTPPPSTSSRSTLKSSCQPSPRLTSSTLAPPAHSCLSSACSFSSDLRLSNRSSRTSSFDVFFYSSHPSIFSASCISSMDSLQLSIHFTQHLRSSPPTWLRQLPLLRSTGAQPAPQPLRPAFTSLTPSLACL
ncbi:hypothetical protein CRENBAI_019388 [Crenichthys baileyi]|uniref:Uncharacterized protein n=1 Tax=Crenichthys baileyi TaxID=28760 RepID=A0AAV9SHM6_9TELE